MNLLSVALDCPGFPKSLWEILFFCFGLCVGSFLNVCIARLPAAESIVSPRSRCPFCRSRLPWYENIPVISYIFLRGRCSHCHIFISPQYPLIELMTGLFFLAVFVRFESLPLSLLFSAFIAVLITAAFIDLKYRIIPDELSFGGLAVGLLASIFRPDITILNSALAALIGGGSLLMLALVYKSLSGRDGMGLGDVKLTAMIGAFLGLRLLVITILIASASGALVGLTLILFAGKGRKYALPFGPYLAIGAISALFFGEWLSELFLNS